MREGGTGEAHRGGRAGGRLPVCPSSPPPVETPVPLDAPLVCVVPRGRWVYPHPKAQHRHTQVGGGEVGPVAARAGSARRELLSVLPFLLLFGMSGPGPWVYTHGLFAARFLGAPGGGGGGGMLRGHGGWLPSVQQWLACGALLGGIGCTGDPRGVPMRGGHRYRTAPPIGWGGRGPRR